MRNCWLCQPEVEEKPDRYEITVDTTEIQGNAIEALKQAVAGRLGKRLLVTHTCKKYSSKSLFLLVERSK